ncbi:MAG: hypothetical protein KBD76_08020 [Bacteriovorax sp.]|jgi:hypothetical protein|nr:hypothetical protein [Bacteriovorax sp.]
MKKNAIVMTLLTSLLFAHTLKADDVILPVIEKPLLLQEGVQTKLTDAQIAELTPWARDSKVFLNDLLENIQELSIADKIDHLITGIKSTVGESAPKNAEILLRYTLNRALVLDAILSKEVDNNQVGSADARLRVLVSSIKMALKYYDTDMDTLTKKSPAPFISYGNDYFQFLNELNKSIFDASAQMSIQRTALEWLNWDYYRDLNNISVADRIIKINNGLKTFPLKTQTDAQAIALVRQMKKLSAMVNKIELKKVKEVVNQEIESNNSEISNKQNPLPSNQFNYNNSNFKICYELMRVDHTSNYAVAKCKENNQYDFTNSNFKACYNLIRDDHTSGYAVDKCKEEYNQYDFTNSNFKACYDLIRVEHTSGYAADKCKKEYSQYDFTNSNFKACYDLIHVDHTSGYAADKCKGSK